MSYKNRIWVYTVAYNEDHFVKHFLTAYAEAEKIVVYDNFSLDRTVSLLSQDPRVEIRYFDSGKQIRDDLYLEIKNHAWKEARDKADWVIVIDFDEVFQRARLVDGVPHFDLDLSVPYDEGVTIFRPFGYNMVSLDAPLGSDGHPFEYVQKGSYHDPAEKLCCFRPDQILEINYIPGCHGAKPKGNVKMLWHKDYKMLHYRYWNLEHDMEEMADHASRISDWNKRMGAGMHYLASPEYTRGMITNGFKLSEYLFDIIRDDSCGPNRFYQ
jgi:hypothetical protein